MKKICIFYGAATAAALQMGFFPLFIFLLLGTFELLAINKAEPCRAAAGGGVSGRGKKCRSDG